MPRESTGSSLQANSHSLSSSNITTTTTENENENGNELSDKDTHLWNESLRKEYDGKSVIKMVMMMIMINNIIIII